MNAADIHLLMADSSEEAKHTLMNAAQEYIGTLQKNGQALGEPVFGWTPRTLRVTLYLAGGDALEDQHHSSWGLKARQALTQVSASPTVQWVEEPTPPVPWAGGDRLYLFTHMFDHASPVCAGADGRPIPTYRLPLAEGTREALHFWAQAYREHDSIAIQCGALEIAAYRQLAEPMSELSRTGRDLCAKVESAVGAPTFYYLHRYWGRRNGENTRPCPGCGSDWSQKTVQGSGILSFPFLCESCRLVSHMASTDDDERHAQIGEWSKHRRAQQENAVDG